MDLTVETDMKKLYINRTKFLSFSLFLLALVGTGCDSAKPEASLGQLVQAQGRCEKVCGHIKQVCGDEYGSCVASCIENMSPTKQSCVLKAKSCGAVGNCN